MQHFVPPKIVQRKVTINFPPSENTIWLRPWVPPHLVAALGATAQVRYAVVDLQRVAVQPLALRSASSRKQCDVLRQVRGACENMQRDVSNCFSQVGLSGVMTSANRPEIAHLLFLGLWRAQNVRQQTGHLQWHIAFCFRRLQTKCLMAWASGRFFPKEETVVKFHFYQFRSMRKNFFSTKELIGKYQISKCSWDKALCHPPFPTPITILTVRCRRHCGYTRCQETGIGLQAVEATHPFCCMLY